MARKFSIPTGLLIGGAVVLGGAFLLLQNPNIINQILHPVGGGLQPSSATNQGPAVVTSAPQQATSVVTPPLSQIEGGTIIPFQQNAGCDPTLGYNWNPLTGRCERHLESRSGNCAQGSHFDSCQCQCVPNGIPQPKCYRDCRTSCVDKLNTVWSPCVLGCIAKSAAYGDPSLLSCPPQQ